MIKKSVVLFLGSLFVLFFFGVHISHAAQSAPNTTTWGSDTTIASEIGSYYDFEFTSRNSIALSEDELPYVDIQFPS